MATVTITIPDEAAARVAAAVCGSHGYVPSSSQDATEYVKSVVFRWLRDTTIEWEATQAANAMRENANDPLIAATLE